MTAKLFGSLLLVGAGLYIALLLARYEHRRVGVLDGYLSLLRFIRGQIDCFSMPIGQILATVDPSVLAACRGQDPPSAPPLPFPCFCMKAVAIWERNPNAC